MSLNSLCWDLLLVETRVILPTFRKMPLQFFVFYLLPFLHFPYGITHYFYVRTLRVYVHGL